MAFYTFPIIVFLIISYGFGLFVTRKIKFDNLAEKIFLIPAFGLGGFVIIALLIRWSPIPLDWRIFLILSLIYPAWLFVKKTMRKHKDQEKGHFFKKINKKAIWEIILALVIFVSIFWMFHHGAFGYNYLEDDDPWIHAGAMNYVAEFKTTGVEKGNYFEKYLEPYPPGFVFLTGFLEQISPETIWTLKFFNILILALGYAGFYFVFKQFLNKTQTTIASLALLITPCFFGHFIWASSLAMLLFVPSFYAMFKLSRIKDNKLSERKSFMAPFIISFLAMTITQMSNPFIFGILYVFYLIALWIACRRFPSKLFWSLVIVVILSLSLFWFPMFAIHGVRNTLGQNSIKVNDILGSINTKKSGGGAEYSFRNFLTVDLMNKMDNPYGFGSVLFLIALGSIVLLFVQIILTRKSNKKTTARNIMVLLWFFFSLYGVLGNSLPGPALMPHRFWSILAIPTTILFAIGITWLFSLKYTKNNKYIFYSIAIILVIGLIWGSLYPKIYIQSLSKWPAGTHVLYQYPGTLSGYQKLPLTTPKEALIFGLCGGSEDKIFAYDRKALPWDKEVQSMKREFENMPNEEIEDFFNKKGFDYMTFDFYCLVENSSRYKGIAKKLTELQLPLVHNESGYYLIKV
jgi:hypothetical protein